jgi:hypothetical protein
MVQTAFETGIAPQSFAQNTKKQRYKQINNQETQAKIRVLEEGLKGCAKEIKSIQP